MSASLSTPERVERLKGVEQETKGSTPETGLRRGICYFCPPIASLHWGLFILKTFGLPNTNGHSPLSPIVPRTLTASSFSINPRRGIEEGIIRLFLLILFLYEE
jgi:hypothetical protein